MDDLVGGEVVEASFYHSSSNLRPQVCVRHWRLVSVSGADPLPAQVLADALSALWSDAVLRLMPISNDYVRCMLREVHPDYTDEIESLVGADNGLVNSPALPPDSAACLVLKPFLGEKYRIGRCYLPSASEVHNNNSGDPTPGYAILTIAMRNLLRFPFAIFAGASEYSVIPVLWSRLDAQAFDIDTVTLRGHWSQQRRRGGFWGPLPPL